MIYKFTHCAATAAGAALILLSGVVTPSESVHAQGTAAPAVQEEGGLETIIVTARKRTESVQDVPVAVQAISGLEIRRQDLTSLEKVAATVPDFTVGRASNGSGAQLTLRGIGSSSTSIGIEQSVAVVVDEVYYGQGRIIEEGFFDLSEMQILKGPQALFFGKNATAGVIALNSADPKKETEFLTKVAYEFRTRQTQAEAIASGYLTDTLGLRVALRGSVQSGGYYANEASPVTYTTLNSTDFLNHILNPTTTPAAVGTGHFASSASSQAPGEHEFLGRVTLKWTPNDQLTGTLKLSTDYNRVNNSSWNYVAYNCPGGSSSLGAPGVFTCGPSFVTHQNNIPADIAATFPYARDDGQLYNLYQSYAATGTLAYKVDDFTVTSVSNYQTNNNSWACDCNFQSTNSSGTWATENSTWKALSEELRVLSTFKSPVNFMLGVLGQKTRRDFDQWIMFASFEDPTAGPVNRYLGTTKTSFTDGKTLAVFGQGIWAITPSVEFTAGARYTHETKDSMFSQPYNNFLLEGIFRPANAAQFGIVSASQSFSNFSPEATISWKPMQDVMLYAAYKTAYKSGGFDNSGINSAAIVGVDPATYMTFNPEKAKGFELGAKTTLFDNQLRFNVTLFDYKYQDLQVQFFNSATFAFEVLSAQAKTQGVEIETEFAPRAVKGLTVNFSINYNDAKYTNFIGPCYAGQHPDAGCPAGQLLPPFQDLSGQRLGMAPKVTGVVGGRYEIPIGTNGNHFDISANARYSDSYVASGFGAPTSLNPSYVVFDATLRMVGADDKWEMALVGKNLGNKFFVSGVVDGPGTGSNTGAPNGVSADQLGFGNLPRTVAVQATYKF